MTQLRVAVAHENKRSLALEWFMVLVWVAICVAASAVLYQRGTENVPLWVLIVLGVMSLFGVLLLWGLAHRTISMAKFGAIGLEVLTPATIGGRFRAAMKLPPAARGASDGAGVASVTPRALHRPACVSLLELNMPSQEEQRVFAV